MDLDVDIKDGSPEMETGEPSQASQMPEPRITNRAQGGVRTDKTRFIRPVERQRMRPWLIDHLDKNDIPGLVWQEKRDDIFRISWKHAANQCFNMQKDTNLFERWAIHTGRHHDSDHKRWKANFRCALNSLPDVAEMKDQGVKKGNNAFKVYRFLDEKEAKAGKESKAKKKREAQDQFLTDTSFSKVEDEVKPASTGEGSSFGIELVSGGAGTSLPDLHQLVSGPSGVDLLLEADSKERLQPMEGAMDNLQEILAAATASLAAGGDAQALEKISIEQLSRLGEVSRIKLDIRQSDRKRRKKEVSGILNVFLCNWCEKVFPTKTDLFQHFLVLHQDKLLSGEDYGAGKTMEKSENLQQEIEDLEKKVLGFTQETYQSKDSPEEVIEDGQVVDLSSDNSMTSQDVYIEDSQVLDLSVAGALAKHPQQHEVALDLSMASAYKNKNGQRNGASKVAQKRRRSSSNDVSYNDKFTNYGLAGAPRTKRQMSLLMKRKEEEEEKQRRQSEAQHSMEDIVHAEILMSLKTGSQEENDGDSSEVGKNNEDFVDDSQIYITTSEEGGEKSHKIVIQVDKDEEQIDNEKLDKASDKVLEVDRKGSVSNQTGTGIAELQSVSNGSKMIEKSDGKTVLKVDKKANSGKPYKCALCVERFEDPTELLQHVSVHKTLYTCSVCNEVMSDKNVYLSHVESHLPYMKYKEKVVNETDSKKTLNISEEKEVGNESSAVNTAPSDDSNCVDEKGDSNGKPTCVDDEDNLKDSIENTGQKNLQAEPAVVPAAGSDNLTGIANSAKHPNSADTVDSKSLSDQESVEKEVNCKKVTKLQPDEKTSTKNDFVDGELDGTVHQRSHVIDRVYSIGKVEIQAKDERNRLAKTDEKEVFESNEKSEDVVSKSDKKLARTKGETQLVPKNAEDTIKNNVFHCGICELKLPLNGVHSHFESHKSGVSEVKFIDLNDTDSPCMICRQKVPVKRINSHLKSHSIYELSQAIKLQLGKVSPESKMGEKIPYKCNLCSSKFSTFTELKIHVKAHLRSKIIRRKSGVLDKDQKLPTKGKQTIQQKKQRKRKMNAVKLPPLPKTNVFLKQTLKSCNEITGSDKMLVKIKKENEEKNDEDRLSKMKTEKSTVIMKAQNAGPRYRTLKFEVNDLKTGLNTSQQSQLGKVIHVGMNSLAVFDLKEPLENGHLDYHLPNKGSAKGKKRRSGELANRHVDPKIHKKVKVSIDRLKVSPEHKSEMCSVAGKCKSALKPQSNEGHVIVLTSDGMEKTEDFQKPYTGLDTGYIVGADKETVDREHQCYSQNTSDTLEDTSDESLKKNVSLFINSDQTNAPSPTLHNLQRNILLVKKGALTVATPVYASVGKPLVSQNGSPVHQCHLTGIDSGTTSDSLSLYPLSSVVPVSVYQNVWTLPTESIEQPVSLDVTSRQNIESASADPQFEAKRNVLGKVSTALLSKSTKFKASVLPIQATKTPVVTVVKQPNRVPNLNLSELDLKVSHHEGNVSCDSKCHDQERKGNLSYGLSSASVPVSSNSSTVGFSASASSNQIAGTHSGCVLAQAPSVRQVGDNSSASSTNRIEVTDKNRVVNSTPNDTSCSITQQQIQMPITTLHQPSIKQKLRSVITKDRSLVHSEMRKKLHAPCIDSNARTANSDVSKHQFMLLACGQGVKPQVAEKVANSTQVCVTVAACSSEHASKCGRPLKTLCKPVSINKIGNAVGTTQPGIGRHDEVVDHMQSSNTQSEKNKRTMHIPQKASGNSKIIMPLGPGPKDKFERTKNESETTVSQSADRKSSLTKPPEASIGQYGCKQGFKSSDSTDNHTCSFSSPNLQGTSSVIGVRVGNSSSSPICQVNPLISTSISSSAGPYTISNLLSTRNDMVTNTTSADVGCITSSTQNELHSHDTSNDLNVGMRDRKQTLEPSLNPGFTKSLPVIQTQSSDYEVVLARIKGSQDLTPVVLHTTSSSHKKLASGAASTEWNLINSNGATLPMQVGEYENCESGMKQTTWLATTGVGKHPQNVVVVNPFPLEPKQKIRNYIRDNGDTDSVAIKPAETVPVIINEANLKALAKNIKSSEYQALQLADQIITLYSCVICKQAFTHDEFMKHAKKHLTSSSSKCQKIEKELDKLAGSSKLAVTLTGGDHIPDHGDDLKSSMDTDRYGDVYRCCLCVSFFENEEMLSKHYTREHPDMASDLCPADGCAQIFTRKGEVDTHYASKHLHECKLCLQRFRSYVEFQAHAKTHSRVHKLKYFKCTKCCVYFVSKTAFYNHCKSTFVSRCPVIYKEKSVEYLQCCCCFVNFKNEETLKQHFRRDCYNKVVYKCWLCKVGLSEQMYTTHILKHLHVPPECRVKFCHACCCVYPDTYTHEKHVKPTGNLLVDNYTSNHSAEAATASPCLSERRQIIASQDLSTCVDCNIVFATAFEFKQHLVFHHKRTSKLKFLQNFGKMSNILSASKARNKYFRHKKATRTSACESCGKSFYKTSMLQKHGEVCQTLKRYFACKNPNCLKKFKTRFSSERHTCTNRPCSNSEKDGNIPQVEAAQCTFQDLKEYILQHDVEECRPLLEKVSSTNQRIQECLGDHFLCQYCNQRYGKCVELKTHMKAHHASILERCIDCDAYFVHETDLLKHREECSVKGFSDEDFHTKKTVLGCEVCLNSFMSCLRLTKCMQDGQLSGQDKDSESNPRNITEQDISTPDNSSRKFVCINCKNEYCNAEDFFVSMKSRLVMESNKSVKQEDEADIVGHGVAFIENLRNKEKALDIQRLFFCHDCEAVVCFEDYQMCEACLKHYCYSSETII